jgi:hypothetical protein
MAGYDHFRLFGRECIRHCGSDQMPTHANADDDKASVSPDRSPLAALFSIILSRWRLFLACPCSTPGNYSRIARQQTE